MAEHPIVQSAKQGDPKAIAYLITHSLQNYGITARASRQGLCLKLLLEAEQMPHQATMVRLVKQGMQKLDVEILQMVKLYGRQLGQPTAGWRHVIELLPQSRHVEPPSLASAETAPDLTESQMDSQIDSQSAIQTAPHNGAPEALETLLFQMNDLDPEAMILLPIDPELRLDDLDPDSLILFPVEPLTTGAQEAELADAAQSEPAAADWDASTEQLTQQPPELSIEPSPEPLPEPSSESLAGFLQETDSPDSRAVLDSAHLSKTDAVRPAKLSQRLTLLLLCLLWLALLTQTLGLTFSLLRAIAFSLYAGLDLSSTNQPFAGLLLAVVQLAGFIFAPFSRLSLGLSLIIGCLTLWWLHRIHASLQNLTGAYPISPKGALLRAALPVYNVWGVGQIWLTLANRLAQLRLRQPSRLIQRLTLWFYLALAAVAGLQAGKLGLFGGLFRTERWAGFFDSFWFEVLRDAAVWTLVLVWLRLVRISWRALRQIHKTQMAPFTLARPQQPRRERPFSLSALLLGGSASLLSLGLFNFLLGLIASLVFLSNGLRPESIFPTFYDSESLLILVLVSSFFCIGLGGCLTAHLAQRSAQRSVWLHALGLGVLITAIGLALRHLPLFPALAELPFWFQTASGLLIIPAALLGCGLRQWFRLL